jgi:hypothetical protein
MAAVMRVSMSYFRNYALKCFMLVLMCSILCTELPELSRLSDDASNDFTVLATSQAKVGIAEATHVRPAAYAPSFSPYRKSSDGSHRKPASPRSRDLLALCSTLRT